MRTGRSVRLSTYATTMPKPAMMPSWAKPRYAVGVNDRNPAAAAPAASERGMPTQAADPIKASSSFPKS